MASIWTSHSKFVVFLALFSCMSYVMCHEFEVGGDKGWAVPKNDQFYNEWASDNRFQVDDVLRFEYKKDSVLQVTDQDYNKCRTSQPMFFSNTGDTAFKLERPGMFYFISGVAGHCERGLKMIVKVLEPEVPPPPANGTASPPPKSGAAGVSEAVAFVPVMVSVVALFRAIFV